MTEEKIKFYSLLNDTTFKYLFKNNQTRKYLEIIIEEITGIKLKGYQLLDQELNSGNNIKDYRLDILLKKENEIVNIEMNQEVGEYSKNKNHEYLYRLAGNIYQEGEDYTKKKYITQINFNNSYCKENKNIGISIYELYDKENKLKIEGIKDYEIYLKRYEDICYNEASKKEKYLKLFQAKNYEQMREIVNGEKEGERLVEEIEKLNKDRYFGGLYNEKEMQKKLERSAKHEGFENGLKQGLEQGTLQEKISIAKSMLKEDIPIDMIMKCTKLTKEEIEKLK